MRSKIGLTFGIFLLLISSFALGFTTNQTCAKTPLASALTGFPSCDLVGVIYVIEILLVTFSFVLIIYSVRERKVDEHGK